MSAARNAWMVFFAACAGAPPTVVRPTPRSQPRAAPSLSDECAEVRAADVIHHDVALALRLQPEPSLRGQGTVQVRVNQVTSAIVLDARDLTVLSARDNGAELRFQQDGAHVCISMPEALAAGSEAALELTWRVPHTGRMLHFLPDQVWAGYQTSAWMPTRQDSAARATLALRITAPSSLQVVASGRSLSRLEVADGMIEHAFVLDLPAPPFLFAFGAGRFAEAERRMDGRILRAFGPPAEDLTEVLALTESIYQLLLDRTGAAPPGVEYSQLFVHGDAAQEAAGMSFIGEAALSELRTSPSEDWIFSHELAHQWFAWLVPCADFADFWLNEGFATFFVGIFKEHRLGRSAYEQEVARWRESSARVHAQGEDAPLSLSAPGRAPKPPPADHELQARGVTYARGALVLHKLREELGEAVFWRGIRAYVKSAPSQGVRTEDLRRGLEEASQRDLSAFFAKWVYKPAPGL